MDDLEIALALLEMVVVMYPLTLAAFGLMIRVQQSERENMVLGDRALGLGFASLLALVLLALSGLSLGVFVSINVNSFFVRSGISLLLGVFGGFFGLAGYEMYGFVSNFVSE